jgi:hypothetical protein
MRCCPKEKQNKTCTDHSCSLDNTSKKGFALKKRKKESLMDTTCHQLHKTIAKDPSLTKSSSEHHEQKYSMGLEPADAKTSTLVLCRVLLLEILSSAS